MLAIWARAARAEARSSRRRTATTTSSWPGTLPRAVCPQGRTAPRAREPAAATATAIAYQRQPAGWALRRPAEHQQDQDDGDGEVVQRHGHGHGGPVRQQAGGEGDQGRQDGEQQGARECGGRTAAGSSGGDGPQGGEGSGGHASVVGTAPSVLDRAGRPLTPWGRRQLTSAAAASAGSPPSGRRGSAPTWRSAGGCWARRTPGSRRCAWASVLARCAACATASPAQGQSVRACGQRAVSLVMARLLKGCRGRRYVPAPSCRPFRDLADAQRDALDLRGGQPGGRVRRVKTWLDSWPVYRQLTGSDPLGPRQGRAQQGDRGGGRRARRRPTGS